MLQFTQVCVFIEVWRLCAVLLQFHVRVCEAIILICNVLHCKRPGINTKVECQKQTIFAKP